MNEILIKEAMCLNKGDPKRIQHFIKVYTFSKLIGKHEGLDLKKQHILETAAILHDIAIPYCEKNFGQCHGKIQEKYGPEIAREILEKYHYESEVIERVCYLIAHHHTYDNIDDLDYQILIEADFLVNLYEDHSDQQTCLTVLNKIFKTSFGKEMLIEMFNLDR